MQVHPVPLGGPAMITLWPYGFRAALLAVPFTWGPLLLALWVGELWLDWPQPALRPHILSMAVVVSLLPLLLTLAGFGAESPESTSPIVEDTTFSGDATANGNAASAVFARDSESAQSPASPPVGAAYSREGTAVRTDSYDTFCEGDTDPYLRKRIKTLAYKSNRFIVYLDEDLVVEWACVDHFGLTPEVGRVFNRVAELTALPITHFPSQDQLAFRYFLAEAVARVLRDRDNVPPTKRNEAADAEAGQDALDRALTFYTARNAEISRGWYLEASTVAAGSVIAAVFTLWLVSPYVHGFFGKRLFDIIMGAGAGGAGALLSVLIGARNYTPDTSTAQRIHWFQGAARILAGTLGAVIVALAIKGNLLLGQFAPNSDLFLFVCMAAGWSERLVPNLIERFEAAQGTSAAAGRPKTS